MIDYSLIVLAALGYFHVNTPTDKLLISLYNGTTVFTLANIKIIKLQFSMNIR